MDKVILENIANITFLLAKSINLEKISKLILTRIDSLEGTD